MTRPRGSSEDHSVKQTNPKNREAEAEEVCPKSGLEPRKRGISVREKGLGKVCEGGTGLEKPSIWPDLNDEGKKDRGTDHRRGPLLLPVRLTYLVGREGRQDDRTRTGRNRTFPVWRDQRLRSRRDELGGAQSATGVEGPASMATSRRRRVPSQHEHDEEVGVGIPAGRVGWVETEDPKRQRTASGSLARVAESL